MRPRSSRQMARAVASVVPPGCSLPMAAAMSDRSRSSSFRPDSSPSSVALTASHRCPPDWFTISVNIGFCKLALRSRRPNSTASSPLVPGGSSS